MHLGNVFAAMLSWHSAKSRGGTWLLRIEDLDPQRSKREYALQLEDDLHWLGLDWDEGGTADLGPNGPYSQSRRGDIYEGALARLEALGLTYPCYCTRAALRATEAPHASDGRLIYPGTCRPKQSGERRAESGNQANKRIIVPDKWMSFNDGIYGLQRENLALECGDFVLRRADGAWAYQLAVVVDDIAMGVTDIIRGCDLLPSTFPQLYLRSLMTNPLSPIPSYAHIPLLCNRAGQRLAKRDASLSLAELRPKYRPEEILGRLAFLAGMIPENRPITPAELRTLPFPDFTNPLTDKPLEKIFISE